MAPVKEIGIFLGDGMPLGFDDQTADQFQGAIHNLIMGQAMLVSLVRTDGKQLVPQDLGKGR